MAAFQNRTDFFQDYPEDTCLAAMMTCNGCKDA
ncbi:MAG: CGGC domain-containing protein, partial [Blautia wexlerae]